MLKLRGSEIEIRGVASAEELLLANDLMAKCFPTGQDYWQAARWFKEVGNNYPGFLTEHTRIAIAGNEIAAALRLTSETIRIGEARLKTGCVGWVCTNPRYRNRGLSSVLLRASMEFLRDHRFHVSMLLGIPNFYHRFGFVTVLGDHTITIQTDEAARAVAGPFRLRAVKPGDIPSLQRIHSANDVATPCSHLRSAAHFTNQWERVKPAHVLMTASGKVVAYLLLEDRERGFRVIEAGVTSPESCEAILAAAARLSAKALRSRIAFDLPPTHPLAHHLLQYSSVHEIQLHRAAEGMMAFINPLETLESMIPEWESLLLQSAVCEARTELTLVVDTQQYRIRSNRGAIDIAAATGKNKVSITAEESMHLMTGYRHAQDILDARRRMITPEARMLFAAIFPKRTPFIWPLDRF